MKIAHCIHGVGLGGAQQVIKFIVAARRDPFEHLVYASQSGVFHRQIEEAGATVRILPRRLPKFDPLWVTALRRAMRQDRVDVVHTHLFGDSLHGYLAARRDRRPVVMTLHNTAESRSRLQRLGYRWLIERCRITVACAEFVRRSFLADAAVAPGLIRTIANAIALPAPQDPAQSRRQLEAQLGVRDGAVVLAGIGRMVEQKGFSDLISACTWLRRQGEERLQLVLFGEGKLLPRLRAQAASEGIAEHVVFAGFRDDIRELLPGVDVVVFSSLQEGLPIALLEAMACHRALVVTRVGGIPEAVDDEREALIVEPRTATALRSALKRVIADPALRQKLGAAARRRFERDFAVERMARSYEALYYKAIAKPGIHPLRAEDIP